MEETADHIFVMCRIPTRVELAKRGVQVGSVICPYCGYMEETADHIFVTCITAKAIWWLVGVWLENMDLLACTTVKDILDVARSVNLPKIQKKAFSCVIMAAIWTIWIQRNERIFNNTHKSYTKIVEDIKECSLLWLKHRGRIKDIARDHWISLGVNGIHI
ncbi:putative reverse transcriptase zinc-binding domain-containing protein [Helianthus annuus]|nr:putative reverse transcriptase zinc-binding domain-containing protein [Helianthus annuus]KAJ0927694.1 putative reverse transcriptase zinc-binding domain-containing protein [Helianthus annuus]